MCNTELDETINNQILGVEGLMTDIIMGIVILLRSNTKIILN